jgi:predicted phosphodiesterase
VTGPVAVLSDVHGNVEALRAVLADVTAAGLDDVVVCGDLTWGPEPAAVARLVRELGPRVRLVRGNADRAVLELARGERAAASPRDAWMRDAHPPDVVAYLETSVFSLALDVDGLGPVRFCHGTPRGDTELVTPATPADRLALIAAETAERVLVSGHTHLQFDRPTPLLRSVNPGSVGLPYHDGPPGTAYWAVLGPSVALRSTRYDLDAAAARFRASGVPATDRYLSLLLEPPSFAEVVADAESRVFAD